MISVVDAGAAGWWPVDDHAVTGLAAHDVLHGHPPVMGPRTTTVVSTGVETHHPGPLLYYLLAAPLALFAGGPLGLLVGSALITTGLAWVGCWAAMRAFGAIPASAVAAAFLGLQAALGPGAAVLPFNPYPPAFATLTCGVLGWALLRGHGDLLPHLTFVVSLMIQAHISYLAFVAPAVAVCLLGGLAVLALRCARRAGRARQRWARRRRGRQQARHRPRRGPQGPRRLLPRWRPAAERRGVGVRGAVRWLRRTVQQLPRRARRSPKAIAVGVATLVWLPPAIELVRFHPHNNLQQVLRYVAADRPEGLPFVDVLLTGVGLLGPFPGGMVTPDVWEGPATIATEPRSETAVLVGSAMLLCVLLVAVVPIRTWSLLPTIGARRPGPSVNERACARVALVLVLGCMALGYSMPETSAIFTWNYLQLWAVVLFVWLTVGLVVLRRLLWLLPRSWAVIPTTAVLLVVAALLPAVMADRTGRWDEGEGVRTEIGDIRTAVDDVAGWESRHVVFETGSLGSTYGIAPSVAFGIKDDRPFHLGAIWSLPEDIDFRKAKSAPRGSISLVIRDGRPDEIEQDWDGASRLTRAVQGPGGGWYTVVVVDRGQG